MKLAIQHLTRYSYEVQVALGLHKLFLLPQAKSFQKVVKSKLSVSPTPEGQSIREDIAGNSYLLVWFENPAKELSIKSDLIINCEEFNPFSFIIEPDFLSSINESQFGKFTYNDDFDKLVAAYVHSEVTEDIISFVKTLFSESSSLLDFLVRLTSQIHDGWKHLVREEESLWSPDKTYLSKKGSCRDLAWMQMNLLGVLGLASRFVSGYAFNPELEEGHELHAWLEVFLPGAGWVGMDPSLGLLTDHSYVPLAFHPSPQKTLPVQGKYGGESNSTLFTEVRVQLVKN